MAGAPHVVEFVVVTRCAAILVRGDPDLRPSLAVAPKAAVAAIPALATWFFPILDVLRVVVAVLYFAIVAALRGIPPDVYDAMKPLAPGSMREGWLYPCQCWG